MTNISDCGRKVKFHRRHFVLTSSNSLLIQLNSYSQYNTFGCNSFGKINNFNSFPFKFIWNQSSVGHCQPSVIIQTNVVGPTSQMLHTIAQGNWPPSSLEVFKSPHHIIYERSSPLIHVSKHFIHFIRNCILTYRNNPSFISMVILIFHSVRPNTDRILMK